MSGAARKAEEAAPSPPEAARAPALQVLTFEAGEHLFAVPAGDVARILAEDAPLPPGTTVVDAVGLLGGGEGERRCLVLLSPSPGGGGGVAVSAARAGEVCALPHGRLLPLPGFLFRGENPFLGLIPPGKEGERPVFVLAGPERLLACAGES